LVQPLLEFIFECRRELLVARDLSRGASDQFVAVIGQLVGEPWMVAKQRDEFGQAEQGSDLFVHKPSPSNGLSGIHLQQTPL
jgi:hypothetical protein